MVLTGRVKLSEFRKMLDQYTNQYCIVLEDGRIMADHSREAEISFSYESEDDPDEPIIVLEEPEILTEHLMCGCVGGLKVFFRKKEVIE